MGVLRWTPDAFYRATLHDVHRALTGWKRANGIKDKKPPKLTASEIADIRAWMKAENAKSKRPE